MSKPVIICIGPTPKRRYNVTSVSSVDDEELKKHMLYLLDIIKSYPKKDPFKEFKDWVKIVLLLLFILYITSLTK